MSSTATRHALTPEDRDFLATPRLGFLTVGTRSAADFPEARPVWFESTEDGNVQLFSGAAAPKVRRVRQDPRASVVAANNMGEPEYWISVVGAATVEDEGGTELAARLGPRYWDLTDPARAAALDAIMAGDLVRIVIRPERVTRYS